MPRDLAHPIADRRGRPDATRTCRRCVMDTSDPEITFDEAGICNHCRDFDAVLRARWLDGPEGEARLRALAAEIQRAGARKAHDCVLGLSGGVDSSYLALKARELGLRPLVVHVDAGWNSETAVHNIERVVTALDLDLHTIVIDWEEIRDLQRAFLRSGVPNQDVPQDHAIFAGLYRYAIEHGVRWVLSGGNLASESVLPRAWGHDALDGRHLRAIHRRFGARPLRSFPIVDAWDLDLLFPLVRRLRVLRPLDHLPYDRRHAATLLAERCGWRDYGDKHCESVWTRFFQGHYLPVRLGYDKRRAHLSSLILAGQRTRDAAVADLEREPYPPDDLRRDRAFVLRKLGLTEAEFAELLRAPRTPHSAYPSHARLRRWLRAARQLRRWRWPTRGRPA